MFQYIMRHLGLKPCGENEGTQEVRFEERELKNLANAKKTKGFSDLDQTRDVSFGKLIKALSKE